MEPERLKIIKIKDNNKYKLINKVNKVEKKMKLFKNKKRTFLQKNKIERSKK